LCCNGSLLQVSFLNPSNFCCYDLGTDTGSALILLYEHGLNSSLGFYPVAYHQQLYDQATNGFATLIPNVVAFANHVQIIFLYNTDQASPLIASCLYRIAVRVSRNPHPEFPEALGVMRQTLLKLGSRWHVARMVIHFLAEIIADTQM
jgi:hypothetical protein